MTELIFSFVAIHSEGMYRLVEKRGSYPHAFRMECIHW